jgi:hypothetical protein
VGEGVGVTTGAGEPATETTLSSGGGSGGGGSGNEPTPGIGDELLKTATAKTKSIIQVTHKKSINLYSGIQD